MILPTKTFSAEIERYFRRDSAEVARALNFLGIDSASAFYHRLKSSTEEPPAISRYLRVSEAALYDFVKAIEADRRNNGLIAAGPRIPVAHGVNVKQLLKERGVRATRKAVGSPPVFPPSEETPDLPSRVDHRKMMTPVRNQGYRGTCVAHTAAAMLGFELIHARKATRRMDLSEQYVYWACKQIDGAPKQEGSFIEYGVEVLRTVGVSSGAPVDPILVTAICRTGM